MTLAIAAGPAVNVGAGRIGLPVIAHGLPSGAAIEVQDTLHYDGTYLVDAASTVNQIVLVVAFIAETFTGAERVIALPQDQWKADWLLTLNVRT